MATTTINYKSIPHTQCSTQFSISPPSGSIIAFFGGGNTAGANDPDGWVIADGTGRSNSDGRYNYIANTLLIGTISGTTYTPPDLRGAFLRGAKRGATSSYGSYANDIHTTTQPQSQNHATEVHSHSITQTDHAHPFYIFNDDFNNYGNPSGGNRFGVDYASIVETQDTNVAKWGFNGYEAVMGAQANITINNSTTNTHSNETRPYNFSVNWIIKL